MVAKERRCRWDSEKWQRALAVLVLAEGRKEVETLEPVELAKRLVAVQGTVLARSDIRKQRDLATSIRRGIHKAHLRAVLAMTDADLRALLPAKPKPPAPRKPPGPRKSDEERAQRMPGQTAEIRSMRAAYRGNVHWNADTVMRLAAEILRLRKLKAPGLRSDFQRLVQAQDDVLPLEERRAIGGLGKDWYDKKLKRLRTAIEAALQRLEAQAPQEVPAAAPVQEPVQEPVQGPGQEVPGNAGREDVPKVSAPVLAFATTMAYALDALFAAQAKHVVAAVDERLGELIGTHLRHMTETVNALVLMKGGEVAAQVSANVSANVAPVLAKHVSQQVSREIHQHLASVVHKLMESELGPIALPVVEDPKDFTPLNGGRANGQTPPWCIPVDVVGLNGTASEAVRKAFEGRDDLDIRFMDPNRGRRAEYRRNVVAAIKFMDHPTWHRMRNDKDLNLVTVHGAAQSVIAAINGLVSNLRDATTNTTESGVAAH